MSISEEPTQEGTEQPNGADEQTTEKKIDRLAQDLERLKKLNGITVASNIEPGGVVHRRQITDGFSATDSVSITRQSIFQKNLEFLLSKNSMTVDSLEPHGIKDYVVRRWLREGVSQPAHNVRLVLKRVFNLSTISDIFEKELWKTDEQAVESAIAAVPQRTRASNPIVEKVLLKTPWLVEGWTDENFGELFSYRGTGGFLNEEGVIEFVRRINLKIRARKQFEPVLATDHLDTIADILDTFYRDTDLGRLMPTQ